MDHNTGHDMNMKPPPSSAGGTTTTTMTMPHDHHEMTMHMTFYWGKNAEILFQGWPGTDNLGMYVLALAVVFSLGVLVEWLSHSKVIRGNKGKWIDGTVQTVMYGVRIGLAYLLMLALMSFNVGVFMVAIAGHMLGFLFFGSRVFRKSSSPDYWNTSDLPPMNCC